MRLFADNAKIGKYYIEKENITSVNLVDAMEESMKDNDMSEYRKEYRQSTFEYIKRFCDSIQGWVDDWKMYKNHKRNYVTCIVKILFICNRKNGICYTILKAK